MTARWPATAPPDFGIRYFTRRLKSGTRADRRPKGDADRPAPVLEFDEPVNTRSLFSGARPSFGFPAGRGSESGGPLNSVGGAVDTLRNSAAAFVSSEERSSLLPSNTPETIKRETKC